MREDTVHEMRPEVTQELRGSPVVVWHISAANAADMLCGARLPARVTDARWQRYHERPCAPCQRAYRGLLLRVPASDGTWPAGVSARPDDAR